MLHFEGMILTDYIIADCDKKRCGILQDKIGVYKSVRCAGSFDKERDLLEKTWLEQPEAVLVYVGDYQINAFSALKRIKEITPEVKVVLYSDQSDYAMDAYALGADYFLVLPVDDIKIGKLVFRYIGN